MERDSIRSATRCESTIKATEVHKLQARHHHGNRLFRELAHNSSHRPIPVFCQDIITDLVNTGIVQTITSAGEDCLTVNVQRPSSANARSDLHGVFWIYGGGFEFGSTQTYDASESISTSIAQGNMIYVSVITGLVDSAGLLVCFSQSLSSFERFWLHS
jgi:carboxylesterase type B